MHTIAHTFYHGLASTMLLSLSATATSCHTSGIDADVTRHSIAVVAPEHFHASLVQKYTLSEIDNHVNVYAPDSNSVQAYCDMVHSFNTRNDNPTDWVVNLYTGSDFIHAMQSDSVSDIAVIAGNNRNKTLYIASAVEAGMNVLADKPLAISGRDFEMLKQAYATAESKGLQVCELMTERYDTLNIKLRQMLADTTLFRTLKKGSATSPVVKMTSIHHFYKNVSGNELKRPSWYYDVTQQGEGITDVTTHLIDLVFWQLFPDETISIDDIKLVSASHYPTAISLEQYTKSTGESKFPESLSDKVIDGKLQVLSNGNITFAVKGVYVSIDIRWDFEEPSGGGDTFSAIYSGTNGTLELVQDASTGYVKQLRHNLLSGETKSIDIPVELRLGHEDHFNKVTEKFLNDIDLQVIPYREATNTLTKYYITTKAMEMATDSNTCNTSLP